MKQVLILGGTNFIGRRLVEKLQGNSLYQITLFNRGKRNTDLFAEIPKIHGDRETDDYLRIAGRSWDYIIDCSGYYPNSFEKLLRALKGKVGRYIFISTISVYDFANAIGRNIDEDEPLLACSAEQCTSALPDAYGEKKAEMERILLKQDWLDKIILRPSLVYGKYDFTDRFYYWLWRAKFTDRILLPDNGKDITSITFVDDLADMIIAALGVAKHNTTYNAVTHAVTLRQIAETCAAQLNTAPQLTAVSSKRLSDAGVAPWQDIALWMNGDLKILFEKAERDFDMKFTPFAGSVASTIDFYNGLSWPACKYGMSVEREKSLFE